MKTYGSLTFIRDQNKVRYVICKKNTTIGSDQNNDIQLKKPMVGQLRLAVRQSANSFIYTLNVATETETVLINGERVDPNTDIQLKDSDLISFRHSKFRLNATCPPRKSFKSLMGTYAGPSLSTKSKRKSVKTRRSSSNLNKWNVEIVPNAPLIDLNDNDEESRLELDRKEEKKEIDPRESLTMATQFVTAHSIQIEEETTLQNLTTIDTTEKDITAFVTAVNLNVSADQTLKEKEKSKVNESKPANMDIHNDTFEVDPIESKLDPKTPPFPQALTPRSNLKRSQSIQSPMSQSSARKSVVFNEMVEEHQAEYDKRTGKLFSSRKISKKLFFDSNNDDLDLKDDELSALLGPGKKHIKAQSVKKSTPTMAWTRIPVLVPTRVYSPRPKVIKIGQKIEKCSESSTPNKINIITDCLIKETPKLSIENRSKDLINQIRSIAENGWAQKSTTKSPAKPETPVVEDGKSIENSSHSVSIVNLETPVVEDGKSIENSSHSVSIVNLESSIEESQESEKTAIEKSVCSNQNNKTNLGKNVSNLADSVVVVEDGNISLKQNGNIDTSLKVDDNPSNHNYKEEQVDEKNESNLADSVVVVENENISLNQSTNLETSFGGVDNSNNRDDEEEQVGEKNGSNLADSVVVVEDKNMSFKQNTNIDTKLEDDNNSDNRDAEEEKEEVGEKWQIFDIDISKSSKSDDDQDSELFVSFVVDHNVNDGSSIDQDSDDSVDMSIAAERKPSQEIKTPSADYDSNVDYGIKKLQQPKTPVADYASNVDYGIKKLQQPKTPVADYESNVDYGIKKLQQSKTPLADYETKIDYGVKKLQQQKTPQADYETNVDYAIKKLQQSRTPKADYETNVDYAIKKLQQSRTPKADYESNVDFGLKKLQQPKTPLADYESNVDFGLKKLQQPRTPSADYEMNVDYGIKKLQQQRTPTADYETHVDFGVKKLQQPKTPPADYESVLDFGLKKLQEKPVRSEYDGNLSMVPELFDQYDCEGEDQEENVLSIKKTTIIEEFSTPLKQTTRGKRTKAVVTMDTPVIDDNNEFRRITRSARKAKIKVEIKITANESTEESEEKVEEKNKKPARKVRRPRVIKDEIGLLLDSDDESKKPELDFKKLTENLANAEESEDVQLESASRSSRTRRARARASGNQSKKSSSSDLRLDDVFEMNDDQLIDVSETKRASKKTSVAGRKRKTATSAAKDCDDGTNDKTIEAKKPRGRSRKKQPAVDADVESDQSLSINGQNKENKKNSVNTKSVRSSSKIILPESDYPMRLTDNVQQALDRFNSQLQVDQTDKEDEDDDFENNCTTIKTRLRVRPRITKRI